jgi:hypothetical protein
LPHLFHVRASDGTLLDGAPLLTESAMEEVDMAHASSSKTDKIEHPQEHYETPDDLRKDQDLSPEETKKAPAAYDASVTETGNG